MVYHKDGICPGPYGRCDCGTSGASSNFFEERVPDYANGAPLTKDFDTPTSNKVERNIEEEVTEIIFHHIEHGKGCGDDCGGWLYPVSTVIDKITNLIHFTIKAKEEELRIEFVETLQELHTRLHNGEDIYQALSDVLAVLKGEANK